VATVIEIPYSYITAKKNVIRLQALKKFLAKSPASGKRLKNKLHSQPPLSLKHYIDAPSYVTLTPLTREVTVMVKKAWGVCVITRNLKGG